MLERLAMGADLDEVLTLLVEEVESAADGLLAAILRVGGDGEHLTDGIAPSLPADYREAVEGLPIGEGVGCCGTAAATGRRVVVDDVLVHPFWKPFRSLCQQAGLRSCWSQPIVGRNGTVLGTFALYYTEPRNPSTPEIELIRTSAHLASIAIEHERNAAERLRLEMQMQHVQKLESLGALAGGIAHEFNNLLVGILGNANLASRQAGDDPRLRRALGRIEDAAGQAANLTDQMLIYAGKGRRTPAAVDLSRTVDTMRALLDTAARPGIELVYTLADDLPVVEADISQLQQLVLTLVTNAAEAIEERGQVAVRTASCTLEETTLAGLELGSDRAPGRYVLLEVRDDGVGMDTEARARMFDPFYSTKFTGRGLGLAAVHGIVRTHGGALAVDSRPGGGTCFRTYLPIATAPPPAVEAPPEPKAAPRPASRHVMVVDDEEMVRVLAKRVLESAGHTVTVHDNAVDALATIEGGKQVDVVLLDMSMPGMDGRHALPAIRALRAEMPVVVSTGLGEAAVAGMDDAPATIVLRKPYRPAQLIEAIESLLDD